MSTPSITLLLPVCPSSSPSIRMLPMDTTFRSPTTFRVVPLGIEKLSQ